MLGHECAVCALGFVNSFLVLPWSWVWLRIQAEVFRFVYRVRYLEFVHVLKLISLFVAAVEAFRVDCLQSAYPVSFSVIELFWGSLLKDGELDVSSEDVTR